MGLTALAMLMCLYVWQAENSIMRRRVRIVGQVGGNTGAYPGYFPVSQRFVHCVELGLGQDLGQGQGRVVVEWGGEPDLDGDGVGNLEMIVRYRCGPFPEVRVTSRYIHPVHFHMLCMCMFTYVRSAASTCSYTVTRSDANYTRSLFLSLTLPSRTIGCMYVCT